MCVDQGCRRGQALRRDLKDETDLVYVGSEQPWEAMSRSCTVDAKNGFPAIPSNLTVQRSECSNMNVRLKRSDDPVVGVDLKVEDWRLRSGRRSSKSPFRVRTTLWTSTN